MIQKIKQQKVIFNKVGGYLNPLGIEFAAFYDIECPKSKKGMCHIGFDIFNQKLFYAGSSQMYCKKCEIPLDVWPDYVVEN